MTWDGMGSPEWCAGVVENKRHSRAVGEVANHQKLIGHRPILHVDAVGGPERAAPQISASLRISDPTVRVRSAAEIQQATDPVGG
mgnify:CR=1 FL=1|jgi:hypothetical protein